MMESQAVWIRVTAVDYANCEIVLMRICRRVKDSRRKKFHAKFALTLFFSLSLARSSAHILDSNNNNNSSHQHVTCKSISVFSMGTKLCVTNMNFPFSLFFSFLFFLFTWRFALCSALYNDGILYAKCHSKNHTTSNPSWMSGPRNVHRAHFLSLSLSLSKRMYVKLTIALLNLSRHHQPLAVIRLK